jgi:hypothetical protein
MKRDPVTTSQMARTNMLKHVLGFNEKWEGVLNRRLELFLRVGQLCARLLDPQR